MSGLLSKLEIVSTSPVTAVVRLDGVEIQDALRGLTLTMGAGDFTQATLELNVVEVTQFAGDGVQVFIPGAARDLLISAGWKPPEGDS